MLSLVSLFLLSISFNVSFYDAVKRQLTPSCTTCKWYIPHINLNPFCEDEMGLCRFFKNKYNYNNIEVNIYEYAKHCRDNESLCGPSGYLYDPRYNYDANKSNKSKVNTMHSYNEKNTIDENQYVEQKYVEQKYAEQKYIQDDLEELENSMNGEIFEDFEIEEFERKLNILKEKLKKKSNI